CLGEWLHHLRAGFKGVDHPTRTIRNRLSKATSKPHSGGRWSRPLLLQLEDRLMPGSIVVGISELIQCGERPNPYADFADSSETYVAQGRSAQAWKADDPSTVSDRADWSSNEPSES